MRLGVGGGKGIVRGGVSAGRGGLRGGVGVGPFRISGGTRSSRSSEMDPEIAWSIAKFLFWAAIVSLIVLVIFGPLMYVLAAIAGVTAFGTLYILWLFCHPYRGIGSRLATVGMNCAVHASVLVLLLLMRAFVSNEVRSEEPLLLGKKYWEWWESQYESAIRFLILVDRVFVLPVAVLLIVVAIVRRRGVSREPSLDDLVDLRTRFSTRSGLREQKKRVVDLSQLTKNDRRLLKSAIARCLGELEDFWHQQLRLLPSEDIPERSIRRFNLRFDLDLQRLLDLECADSVILSQVESSRKYGRLSELSPYWFNRVTQVLVK